ncbi:50S ribosomal protein L28 [Desulfurispirillum indicum]|uniref:Large ribosomal subunit protein bL28 n=1 Tax=Desulfurispirillum indicum (strain ATCC BAA-1389 / DSM 22839 / S5) TaxID=653733 RepID=E6W162_DESIS|nr:50S ribosomal protein L28 [Desulfurispirillum indicum]ADU66482.1 ribosomal protein L28 [Desulfurispirillum indicum S5]UCZ55818.1 50S ribosomal protein L28 [Desulfurispirillum indicum]
MARRCEICGKQPQVNNNVSHANNKTKKRSLPNLKSQELTVNGLTKRVKICTSCIRTLNKVS